MYPEHADTGHAAAAAVVAAAREAGAGAAEAVEDAATINVFWSPPTYRTQLETDGLHFMVHGGTVVVH